MSRANVLRSVGLGLIVLVLIGGATFIGAEANDPSLGAQDQLERYYAETDAAGVADRIVPGSLGVENIDRQQLEAGLARILQEPFEVESTETFTVRGTRIVRVSVARPQGAQPLDWCVLPDGGLLIGCRLATAELQGQVQDAPIEVSFSAMDLQPSTVLLAVVLGTTEEEPVPLGDDIRLHGDSFELTSTSYVLGGQQVPADPQDLQVRPGAGLQLVFQAQDVEDLTPYTEGPFTLRWGEGSVRFEIGEVTWFIDGGTSPEPGPTATASP